MHVYIYIYIYIPVRWLCIPQETSSNILFVFLFTTHTEYTETYIQTLTPPIYTGWNYKIVALEKTTWFHFRLMKTGFLFFCCQLASRVQIPSVIGAFYHVWKGHNVQRARWRCVAIQLMLSTDPSYGSQNHRWIATNNRDVPRVMKTKFPAMFIVFGVVSSEGPIMPPHIFEVSLKVNTKVYLDVLKSVVIPWCNQVAGGRPWVWQQDSAPAHKSKETQAWLQKECYDFLPFSHWPPSSPDLNPLDYFVWSYVENITNMTSHNTKASLITAIRRVFAELPPALVEKAYYQFRIRIEVMIEAEVGYIE